MKHLLVPTDFSEASLRAFHFAKEQANLSGRCRLSVITVLEDVIPATVQFEFGLTFLDPSALMKEAAEKARERLNEIVTEHLAGFDVTSTVVRGSGSCAGEICEYARSNGVDLIVMSTHGRSGWRHLVMGSVAEHVIRSAPCPVLIIPDVSR